MKTVTFNDIKIEGDSFTITGKISEIDFTHRTQQQTVMDYPKENPKFERHVQLSNQAVFLKRIGKNSFGLPNCEFTKLAQAIEPSLLPPPPSTKVPVAPIKRIPPKTPIEQDQPAPA